MDRITAAGMPGSFAEVQSGHEQARAASGVADIDTGRPARPWFQHRIGSITKTFVATTILQLVGEARIDLDAAVTDYLPEYDLSDVTVRMLLNHTSGIADFDTLVFATPQDLLRNRHTTFTPQYLAGIGVDAPRNGPPGAPLVRYSNTNYVLAGLIIERVTGRPAAFEVSRRVIWRLGLFRTYFAGATEHIFGPHSQAYIPWLDGELMDFSVYNMSWAWMVGDIVSTTDDVNRFFEALLTGKLLRPNELAEMKEVVAFDPARPALGGYGLGILTTASPCGPLWGHDGVVFGHGTISLHLPDAARQVTVAENMTHFALPGPHPIREATNQLLVQALCPDASTRTMRQWSGPRRVDWMSTFK